MTKSNIGNVESKRNSTDGRFLEQSTACQGDLQLWRDRSHSNGSSEIRSVEKIITQLTHPIG